MRLRRRLSDTPHPLRTRTRNSIRHEIRTVARHPDNFTHIFIYYLCAKGAKSGARSAVCECDKREAIRLREPASRRVASKQNHASARNSHAHISNCVCRTHTHTHMHKCSLPVCASCVCAMRSNHTPVTRALLAIVWRRLFRTKLPSLWRTVSRFGLNGIATCAQPLSLSGAHTRTNS